MEIQNDNCVSPIKPALMYDAMNLNLAQANQTRGYQMYDWLTTKCEQDCGCY